MYRKIISVHKDWSDIICWNNEIAHKHKHICKNDTLTSLERRENQAEEEGILV